MIKTVVLSAALLSTATAAFAIPATVEDLVLRTDVTTTTYSFDLGLIDASAPARLRADVGEWNTNGINPMFPPNLIVDVFVNGSFLADVEVDTGIFGSSNKVDETFSGLLQNGVNTIVFMKSDDFTSNGLATFATDDVRINYEAAAVIPLPASALMLIAGFGALLTFRRRAA